MIQVMEDYDLTKEDWDSIIEVGQFEGQRDPVASIPSKVCTCLILTSITSLHSTSSPLPYEVKRSFVSRETRQVHWTSL